MIQVAFKIKGGMEVSWYGHEVSLEEKAELLQRYGSEEAIEILEPCYDSFNGILVRNPDRIKADELSVWYFIPGEEGMDQPTEDQRVDLARARVVVRPQRRKKCLEGNTYLAGGEAGNGYEETRFFNSGFLPPFKPEEVVLMLDELSDFGFEGCLMTGLLYQHREPDYADSDLRTMERLPSRFLTD